MIQRKQRIPMRDLSTMAAEDREAVEKNSVQPLPHPSLLPLLEASPATHPRSAAHLLREHLPGDTAL